MAGGHAFSSVSTSFGPASAAQPANYLSRLALSSNPLQIRSYLKPK
jgi:hypothetical protein